MAGYFLQMLFKACALFRDISVSPESALPLHRVWLAREEEQRPCSSSR